jgi:transcriptional regulator with XRE-family HTH domain
LQRLSGKISHAQVRRLPCNTDIHVARAETGRQNISVSMLSGLCDYYGISREEFFRGVGSAE